MTADSEATFVFADLAGFTALAEAHGHEEALAVVEEFADAVRAKLPAIGGEHVKTIGDALMLRIPDPGDAVLLGLEIARGLMQGHGAPAVRVGLHHGTAIERDGDCFGPRRPGLPNGGRPRAGGRSAALRGHGVLLLFAPPAPVNSHSTLSASLRAGRPRPI